MKRYRVTLNDFDFRLNSLKQFEEYQSMNVDRKWNIQIEDIKASLVQQYGEFNFASKLENLRELKHGKASIMSHHNALIHQVRDTFVHGFYYPALTGACSLGERLLNHLIIDVREDFRETDEYVSLPVKSNSNWNQMIRALTGWKVLLPDVTEKFYELSLLRNRSLHFNKSLIEQLRLSSLQSVNLIDGIISEQFSPFGSQPWFIKTIPGEIYIKKEWESDPFVKQYFIPNCLYVGPRHKIIQVFPWQAEDLVVYDLAEINDEQFASYRNKVLTS